MFSDSRYSVVAAPCDTSEERPARNDLAKIAAGSFPLERVYPVEETLSVHELSLSTQVTLQHGIAIQESEVVRVVLSSVIR